jgi:hypothetical protein
MRLELDQILAGVGFNHKTRLLTQVMTLSRLIEPSSEAYTTANESGNT